MRLHDESTCELADCPTCFPDDAREELSDLEDQLAQVQKACEALCRTLRSLQRSAEVLRRELSKK